MIVDFFIYLYLIVNHIIAIFYGIRFYFWQRDFRNESWIDHVMYEDKKTANLSLFTILFNGWFILGITAYVLYCFI